MPGGARVDSWAISSVTVAPTHRRRGIARAFLTGELRTAQALGLPLAILTVSESVIYGRWGFGPATFASEWRVDTKRVRWAGGETPGRLSFTQPEDYRETGRAVLDRVMAGRTGEIGLTRTSPTGSSGRSKAIRRRQVPARAVRLPPAASPKDS